MSEPKIAPVEWQTLAMLALGYVLWALGTSLAAAWFLPLGMVMVSLGAALHSSLSHEALHGHPTRARWINEALVFPALSLMIPYRRFRDTHLAHHHDARLTDPYDDPESNYMDPAEWACQPGWFQALLRFNNTLLGRLVVGPLIGQLAFMQDDWRLIRKGDRAVRDGWLWHIPALGLVIGWLVAFGQMPLGAFVLSSYAALSILKIRTFLEHRAHEEARGRTVVIEDRGPLALIFLNNSLHVVHHSRPGVPWYRLWPLYRAERERFLKQNDGYVYRSYGEVFRRYFWRAKDPVPHPLWRAK